MSRTLMEAGAIGTVTTRVLESGRCRATCRVRGYDGRDRFINRFADTKTRAERVTRDAAAILRDQLRLEYEAHERARQDAERGITPQRIDPTTVRELAGAWRVALAASSELHGATIRSWDRLLASMFGEPRKLRGPAGDVIARTDGPRQAFELIADKKPRDVTARDLKDVLAHVSKTNGSSTARQLRTVLSYVFGVAEEKNLVIANPVPLLRGNKGSPVIGRNKVSQTGLNHRRSPAVEVVDALREALREDPEAARMTGRGGSRYKAGHPRPCGACATCVKYLCERPKSCGTCDACQDPDGQCTNLKRCYKCAHCRSYIASAGGTKKLLCESPAAAPRSLINGADVADLVDFLFMVGCRLGEALAVRWSDLTLVGSDGEIRIRATVVYGPTGGGAIRQEHTKTGDAGHRESGARTVYLIPEAVDRLRDRARHFGVDLNSKSVPAAPIFGSPQEPKRIRDPRNTSRVIKRLFSKHGVTWGRSHIGRKYLVNRLDAEGVPHIEIAKIMGWRDLNTIKAYLDTETGVSESTKVAMRQVLARRTQT